MIAVDLETCTQHCAPQTILYLNRFSRLSLRDRDHFPGSLLSLKANVHALLPSAIQNKPYRVMLLSQMAHFGFAFNPISFFVISAADSEQILGFILEVHNTPWGERHYYPVFDFTNENGRLEAVFKKVLHVSPFMKMDFDYAFAVQSSEQGVRITMDNWQNDIQHLNAGVMLVHQPLEPRTLRQQFWRQPFSPHKVVLAIYWEALKLWWKGVPFCPHPSRSSKS
jgi:DUF1365 family protein